MGVVWVVQVLGLVLQMRGKGVNWEGVLKAVLRRAFGDRRGLREEEGRRPLLVGAAASEEDLTRYEEDALEEDEVVEERWDEEEAVERQRRVDGYGAVGRGAPRVEPAHHDPWGDVERV